MNFGQKITICILLSITMCNAAFAQVVDIPDPNLRAAIRKALHLTNGNLPVTQSLMRNRLRVLDISERGIVNLSGIEHATRLRRLIMHNNPIADLAPISNLTHLEDLNMWGVHDIDISPLASIASLRILDLTGCNIDDIRQLSTLTNLEILNLSHNRITDVSPLSHLTKLHALEIRSNRILDHSPLDALSLSHFVHDDTCEMPPFPLMPRLQSRTFPSVFGPWGNTLNQPGLSYVERSAQRDLVFADPMFGLEFFKTDEGWALRGHLESVEQWRNEYLDLNPNMIFLVEMRMRDTVLGYFPDDSDYWIRDFNDQPVPGWKQHYLINFIHPDVQEQIIQQTIAVSKCGLFDGIIIDWWDETGSVLVNNHTGELAGKYLGLDREAQAKAEQQARDNILQGVRIGTRQDFLIFVVNSIKLPRTGPHINGSFMESLIPFSHAKDEIETQLNNIEDALLWLETNHKPPRINGLEGWSIPSESPDSPTNRRWMRAFTTLSLTHSDGYVLYQTGEGHDHYWYDFWDAELGRPVGEKSQLYQDIDGLYIREFTNGWAVYNHSGAEQTITLPELASGVASRVEGTSHTLPNLDGEMYIRVKPVNSADVNGDGVVNIFDLTIVAQAFGTGKPEGDVNGDGVINVFDLVMVAEGIQ